MTTFRNYSNVNNAVRENYRLARQNQTVNFVNRMIEKYGLFDRVITIWDALEQLNILIDVSDPDMDHPNIYHAIQTAERLRQDNHPEWLQVVGLIHDLGKIMYLRGSDDEGTGREKQWAMVGDTFVVGCTLPDTLIFPEFNQLNPDMNDERYNTQTGQYKKECGLDNVQCSWGHDEYLYRILVSDKNQHTLPPEALYIIRFHSLYAYHDKSSYQHFMSSKDREMLHWLKLFNQYDLYTKSDTLHKLSDVKDYYTGLLQKFFSNKFTLYLIIDIYF